MRRENGPAGYWQGARGRRTPWQRVVIQSGGGTIACSSHAGGFSSLPAVATLFSQPWLLLAGWVHYLSFDLFIGAWETRDSQAHRIPHFLVVPCLLLTFMLGPIGLLAYFVLRTLRGQTVQA